MRAGARGASRTPALAGFEAFYAAYPRHESRADAERAWGKIRPDDELQEQIRVAITRQRERGCLRPGVTREGRSTIPLPATWLNGRKWEDEPEPGAAPSTSARQMAAEDAAEERERQRRALAAPRLSGASPQPIGAAFRASGEKPLASSELRHPLLRRLAETLALPVEQEPADA